MRKILFEIYLLFFFVGIAQPILSQSPYYYYKQLGIKEGLSQSKVQCVLMIIGGIFGLARNPV